ncbi:hypothetical protein [Pseudonocardia sp. T1-2H]|uniref:hypothetical protein n=1 Tax=Pseudonocardia sp. T1-2H TaxID=3128899 RepID=UPI00310139FA
MSGDRLVERGSGWINGASLSAAFCGVMTSAGSRLMISALAGPISQDVFADEPASVVVGARPSPPGLVHIRRVLVIDVEPGAAQHPAGHELVGGRAQGAMKLSATATCSFSANMTH